MSYTYELIMCHSQTLLCKYFLRITYIMSFEVFMHAPSWQLQSLGFRLLSWLGRYVHEIIIARGIEVTCFLNYNIPNLSFLWKHSRFDMYLFWCWLNHIFGRSEIPCLCISLLIHDTITRDVDGLGEPIYPVTQPTIYGAKTIWVNPQFHLG